MNNNISVFTSQLCKDIVISRMCSIVIIMENRRQASQEERVIENKHKI